MKEKTKITSLPLKEVNKKRRKDMFLSPLILMAIMLFITIVFFTKSDKYHLIVGIPMAMFFLVSLFGKGEMLDFKLRAWYFIIGGLGITPSIYELFFR